MGTEADNQAARPSLFNKKGDFERMKAPAAIVFLLISALMSALAVFFSSIICAVLSIALLAAVIVLWQNPAVLLQCAAAYAFALAFGCGYIHAACVAYIFVSAAVLALCILLRASCGTATLACGFIFAAGIFAYITLNITAGGVGFYTAYSNLAGQLKAAFIESASTYFSALQLNEAFSNPYMLDELLTSSVMLLPAFCMIFIELVGFACSKLCYFVIKLRGGGAYIFGGKWRISLSRPSAVIYLISFLLIGILSFIDGADMFYYAFVNIALSFLLPFCIIGVHSLWDKLNGMPYQAVFLRNIIKLCVIVFAFLSPAYFAFIFSFVGALKSIGFRKRQPE